MKTYHDGRVTVHGGDCLAVLAELPADSFDAVVTDPPYHFASIVKRFAKTSLGDETETSARSREGRDGYARSARGFMGRTWDGGQIAHEPETWAAVLRVLKPGGHMVAFHAPKNWHRLAVAIEDAGFEIRDTLLYLFGSGFPKSHNMDHQRGKLFCGCETVSERDMRRMHEADLPETLDASDQHSEILQQGLPEQGLSQRRASRSEPELAGIEQSSLEGRGYVSAAAGELRFGEIRSLPGAVCDDGQSGRLCDGASPSNGAMDQPAASAGRVRSSYRPQSAQQFREQSGTVAGQPEPQTGGAWPLCERCGKPIIPAGLGTALKPAYEPIVLARRPLVGMIATNVMKHGTGALNIDACRVGTDENLNGGCHSPNVKPRAMNPGGGTRSAVAGDYVQPLGRWPANVVHDGSDEVVSGFPESQSGEPREPTGSRQRQSGFAMTDGNGGKGDSGSAARFFATFPRGVEWTTNNASDAAEPLSLQSEAVVSVLSHAAEALMLGLALQKQSYRADSTTVTASELRTICELVTIAIQNIESAFSRESPRTKLTLSRDHVSIAAIPAPTGITTIIISLLKSNGRVDRATFAIIETSAALGVSDSDRKRFHYTSKADADDRLGSKHPTVKPLNLLQWLVRLITPPGGHVLDPFAGTGTTAEAALREGFRCTLIEREAEYLVDIDRRMAHVFDGEVGRGVAIAKTKPDSTAPAPLLDYIEAPE